MKIKNQYEIADDIVANCKSWELEDEGVEAVLSNINNLVRQKIGMVDS